MTFDFNSDNEKLKSTVELGQKIEVFSIRDKKHVMYWSKLYSHSVCELYLRPLCDSSSTEIVTLLLVWFTIPFVWYQKVQYQPPYFCIFGNFCMWKNFSTA